MEDTVVYYGSNLNAVINNLQSGQTYTYRVKSTNLVGDSDWSSEYSFLIVDKPSPPLNLEIVSFDNT